MDRKGREAGRFGEQARRGREQSDLHLENDGLVLEVPVNFL
jgi:hypothetical protein